MIASPAGSRACSRTAAVRESSTTATRCWTIRSEATYSGPGIAPDWVPRGASQVVVHLRDRGAGGGDRDVILEGGLLGVEQDEAGRLAAVPGWLARPPAASTAALLDRLREGPHHVDEPAPSKHPVTGSLELVTIYRELSSATLFPGAREWRLRPMAEHERIAVGVAAAGQDFPVERILDLPDGTIVGVAHVSSGRRFVRLSAGTLGPLQPPADSVNGITVLGEVGKRTTAQRAADVPVLDGNLTAILARALDTGGSTNLPVTGESLEDVLPGWARIPAPSEQERREAREAEQSRRQYRRSRKAARQAELRARLPDPADPRSPPQSDTDDEPS